MSNVAQIEESIYPNFPPHPYGFEKPANLASPPPDYIANEPAWLKGLRENNQPLYLAAMNPANWNWQLAYLDSGYLNAVLAAPSANKFSRRALNMGAFTNGTTRLKDTEQLVQGALYFNLFTPSIGWGSINPDMEIMVEVLGNSTNDSMYFQVAPGSPLPNDKAQFLGFVPGILGNHDKDRWIFATNRTDSAWGGRRYGGLMPYEYALNAGRDFTQRLRERVLKDAGLGADYLSPFEKFNFVNGAQPNKDAGQAFGGTYARKDTYQWDIHGGRSRVTPLDRGYDLLDGVEVDKTTKEKLDNKNAQSYRYDLVTIPFKVTGASVNGSLFTPGEIEFHGGDLKFSFYHGGERSERSAPNGDKKNYGFDGGEVIQEVTVYIPEFHFGGSKSSNGPYGLAPVMFDRNQAGNDNYQRHLGGRYNDEDALWKDSFSFFERNSLGADPGNPYIVESGSALKRGGNNRVTIHENSAGLNFASYAAPVASGRFAHLSVHDRPTLFSPNDIVQSVEIRHGDARISAGRAVIEKNEVFAPHREYNKTPMAHSATGGTGSPYYGAVIDPAYLIRPGLGNGAYGYGTSESRIPLPFGVERSDKEQLYGDFDNGSGLMIDGPYINKPDEGNTHSLKGKFMKEVDDQWGWLQQRGEFPYFNRDDIQESGGPAYFSPNRLVSGPGMFGSLPTGVLTDEPWRTLLFRPATNGTEPGFQRHPGGGEQEGGTNPPDHLIMDLFWMPVVEPYAISEPLSTGGKVNMNFDIVPFQHIQRSTALRGVFRSELMLCIPNQWHQDYKHNFGRGRGYHWRDKPTGGSIQFRRLRAAIREDDTIAQFYDRFDNGGEIFKSATEICEIDLIPEEMQKRMNLPASTGINSYVPTKQEMDSGKYWKDHSLVGDNS
ncbi:MAG TPA: hypothetical protein PLA50_02130, partial [Bacteroidia bacterium]|nr:hypothetical protein [Bacteroidia bacterium]